MDTIKQVLDLFLHLQDHLHHLTREHGAWIYGILFLIIFAETGLVVTPILPTTGGTLMTNSGKFAHYGPANLRYEVVYGGLEDCVASAIEGRIAQIRKQVEETTSDYDREKLQERLAKLAGGVAVINVGAATETEMKEKKARVEDALHATRAAVEEGIVPGGGVALLRASEQLKGLKTKNDDQKTGVEIVRRALSAPARQIAINAGEDGSVIVGKVLEKDQYAFGFDSQSGEYGDLVITIVGYPHDVEAVYLGAGGIVASAESNASCCSSWSMSLMGVRPFRRAPSSGDSDERSVRFLQLESSAIESSDWA